MVGYFFVLPLFYGHGVLVSLAERGHAVDKLGHARARPPLLGVTRRRARVGLRVTRSQGPNVAVRFDSRDVMFLIMCELGYDHARPRRACVLATNPSVTARQPPATTSCH